MSSSTKMNKKNNLKKNSKMNKKKQGSSTGNEVADKLYSQFEKHKEVGKRLLGFWESWFS